MAQNHGTLPTPRQVFGNDTLDPGDFGIPPRADNYLELLPDYTEHEMVDTVEAWHGVDSSQCPWVPPPSGSGRNERTWLVSNFWGHMLDVDKKARMAAAARAAASTSPPASVFVPPRVSLDSEGTDATLLPDSQETILDTQLLGNPGAATARVSFAESVNASFPTQEKRMGGGKKKIVVGTPVCTRAKKDRAYGVIRRPIDGNDAFRSKGQWWEVEMTNGELRQLPSSALTLHDATQQIPEVIRPTLPPLPRNPDTSNALVDNEDNRSSSDESDLISYFDDSDDNPDADNDSVPSRDDGYDPNSRQPPISYAQKLTKARHDIFKLLGEKVKMSTGTGRKKDSIEWKVIEESTPKKDAHMHNPHSDIYKGLTSFEHMNGTDYTPIACMFCHFMFPNLFGTLRRYNECVTEYNNSLGERALSRNLCQYADIHFLLSCFAIMISSACFGVRGERMWLSGSTGSSGSDLEGIVAHPNLDKYVPLYRFNQFKRYVV
jgi:hypothetical protein